MAQASRDENYVPTLLGVSNVDGTTPVKIYADPTTHRLLIDNAGGATLVVGTTAISNGTNGRVLYDDAGVLGEYTITGTGSVVLSNSPTFVDDITIGAAGGSTGSILFKGTTSGTVTLSVADAAGTWTMKLPTTDGDSGQFLQTDGSGNTTWATASAGGITIGTTTITSGTDTRVLYDNAGVVGEYTITGTGNVVMSNSPTFLDDITIGTPGTATGSILLRGTTSGIVTLSVADAAGTWTMKLPTTDGDAGQFLQTDGSGNTTWAASSAAAGGNNTEVQYNNAGALGGITGATSNGTTLTITSGRATTDFSPSTNDAASLGTITLGFSDLHLATGGVINWANGEVTLTETDANTLTLGGATTLALGTTSITMTGSLGTTGARLTKGWFTDLEVTNAIVGSITGNAATVTTANEASDTTCFINFTTAASGSLPLKTNTNMTFNSSTGVATFASTVLTTTDINGGTIDGVTIGGASAGAITGTTITANTGFLPDANDGAYLGQSGTAFSDLYLASGALIDFAAGNSVITHSSGVLTVSTGDLRVTTAGTNSASAVTVGGTQTLTNKIISQTFEPGTDDTYTGEVLTGLNAGATIAQWDCVYLGSASKWLLTDADSVTTAGSVMVAMATTSGTDTNPLTVILRGIVRNDGWTWATVGAPLYLDTATPGGMTLTAPSGTDDVVKIVGYVLSDDCIYFNPSNDWITRV